MTPDSVRANLGSLGRVDLVLHRSGREKTVNLRCLHERETYEAGTYEGIIEFNGERGFTRARATRAAGRPALALSPLFTGDLTADFPGRSVRMAGPGVHVSLVHARLTRSSSPDTASISSRR